MQGGGGDVGGRGWGKESTPDPGDSPDWAGAAGETKSVQCNWISV